jgi:tripartite-type tricarboxylate transporter receptor subunit TctC
LNTEIRKILATPEVSKKIVELGGELKDDTPEDLAKWVTNATAQWGEVIKAEGLSLD